MAFLLSQYVGRQDGDDNSRVWFTSWFLSHDMLGAPTCIWRREGRKITKTYRDTYRRPSGKPLAPPMIWILTDEYNCNGDRLGVWPD